ncbi:hypothetical protein HOC67_03085 [Candidatus Peregrinibacteria bacterium]|nr:hypothetical protein [Candidatus Peregrinibacteria bacterium]
MAVVEMQKVALIAHKSLREELLDALHKEGAIEISERKGVINVDHTEVAFKSAELQFAIQTLKSVASKETKAAMGKRTTEQDTLQAASHTDVRGTVDALHLLEQKDTEAEKRIQELISLKEALEPWVPLSLSLDTPTESLTTVRVMGNIPQESFKSLEESINNEIPKSSLMTVNTIDDECFVAINIWKEDIQKFEEIATSIGWTTQLLPCLKGTAAKLLEETTVEKKKLEHVIRKNHEERVRLSVELPSLQKVSTFVRWLNEKQSVRETMNETSSTFTLLGWMPKKRIALLESRLQKVSPAIALLKVKADEGEEAPVLLKNSILVTPFESVTNLFGLPLYGEADPTRNLSPFFILFFALCLTDAGYGAIIALVFGIVLFKIKKRPEEAQLIWLLFLCGILTFIVGIFFGGWLGLQAEKLPSIFTKVGEDGTILFKGQIWNLSSQEGIEFLQNLSMVLGFIHLFLGMWLSGVHKWIHKRKAAAFWQDFTNHILLGAAIFFIAAPEGLNQIATYTLYAALVLMIWGKGYGNAWYIRPIVGAMGLLSFALGLLSNSLSYLRLLALGLVTGALALAVNQVAVEFGNLFPIWIAIPLIVVIFVVGHTVSIALNTLGSFIHAGRLQFIEYFSQFFEGGGRSFAPFRRTTTP